MTYTRTQIKNINKPVTHKTMMFYRSQITDLKSKCEYYKNMYEQLLNLVDNYDELKSKEIKDELTKLPIHKKANKIFFDMYGIDFACESRKQYYVRARQIFSHYMKYHRRVSLNQISDLIISSSDHVRKHKYDHSTIIHNIERAKQYYLVEKSFKTDYHKFVELLES